MTHTTKERIGWLLTIMSAVLIAVVVRVYIFSPIVVDGASMNPTLQDKDRMFVTKIGQPERFDVIVFHAPDGRDFIKRVIGLPGDIVEYTDDQLYINGKPYEEPYLDEFKKDFTNETLTESFTSKTVPEGHLFVMGDNRRNSEDSRAIGPVPMEQVVGTTNMVYYPFDDIRILPEH